MLRVGVICLMFVTQIIAYPTCQNWCNGQQRVGSPLIWNNWGGICNAAQRINPSTCGAQQQPVNPWGIRPQYPNYPVYPNGMYWPTGTYPYQQQQQQLQTFPWSWTWQVVANRPGVTPSEEPVKVVVDNPYNPPPKEWVCPTDPEPRARSVTKENEPVLQECLYDENCPSSPIRQKCCFDYGINGKVCKPAIPL